MSSRIHSVFLAAWYPSQETPILGLFIKEHAIAVSKLCDVSVIYINVIKSNKYVLPKMEITKNIQGNLTEYLVLINTPIRKFGIHDFLVLKAYRNCLRDINKDIDVLHIHVRDHITSLFFKVFGIDIPVVVTEHSSFYHAGINKITSENAKAEIIKNISNWFSKKQIVKVLPVSMDLSNILVNNFGVDHNKVQIVPNVASNYFKFKQKHKKSGQFKILLIANWTNSKNPILFLKSVLTLDKSIKTNIEIDFIGKGEKILEMKSFSSRYLMDVKINYLGWQKKDVIANKLQEADLFVHPTDYENLPCVIIESLCCGTPVLTHRVNGIPELVNDSNGIMCELKDVNDFSKNLNRMIAERGSYNNTLIAENANKKYGQESIGEIITEVYKNIISPS